MSQATESTPTIATPGLLWALLNDSPAMARAEARASALVDVQIARQDRSGRWCEWKRDGTVLQAFALLDPRSPDVAVHEFVLARPTPERARERVLADGIHLRAAMVRDGLWKAHNMPTQGFLLRVHCETDFADFAEYIIGEELEQEGERAFERALSRFVDAERRGWPGWRDLGVQVLE